MAVSSDLLGNASANVSMICFKAVHFAALFISRNSNSQLCQEEMRQSGLFYR
jgi:hypothetical protein